LSETVLTSKEELRQHFAEIQREATVDELLEILGTTVVRDDANKLITFLAMLSAYTERDSMNIVFKADSSTGKSYLSIEVASLFPNDDVLALGYSSPTAFFHERGGVWDPENHVLKIDLSRKVLLFLDMPHDELLKRLRPLLSHDKKEIEQRITDQSEKYGLRTKHVRLIGFPSVVFATAKLDMAEQEQTRSFILSPEVSQEKLRESLDLLAKRECNPRDFEKFLAEEPKRVWLKQRIESIRNASIRYVIVPNEEEVKQKFMGSHQHLTPRHQRDFKRLVCLIKALALFNYAHRKRTSDNDITANQYDITTACQIYEQIMESNELGLAPAVLDIFKTVIGPLINEAPTDKKTIATKYRENYHQPLSPRKLTDYILPALESAGLIHLEQDPLDRRRTLVAKA